MTADQRLRDIVKIAPAGECAENFRRMGDTCRSAKQWIDANCERNDRRMTLCNLLEASAEYLGLAAENIGTHISVSALCTRSLYEINLQTRDVLKSDENLRRWQGEAVTDKIQVLEGVLSLDAALPEARAAARSEIDRLQALRKKYGLPDRKPVLVSKLSESLGLKKEHDGLFKLFSKLVHPSSYLVNDTNAGLDDTAQILQVHAQLYAGDTFTRICDAFSVPDALRALRPASGSRTKH